MERIMEAKSEPKNSKCEHEPPRAIKKHLRLFLSVIVVLSFY